MIIWNINNLFKKTVLIIIFWLNRKRFQNCHQERNRQKKGLSNIMTSKERFENLCPEDLDTWIPVSHALQIDLDCTKVKFITIYHKCVSLILNCTMYMLFWSVTSLRPFCAICNNITIIFFEAYFVFVEKK